MDYDAIVIGAGPAGLTAALELSRLGKTALVLEQTDQVGGISRTETYRGYRFDVGGHRFYTRVPEVERIWLETLGNDLLAVNRLSRIHYRDRFFKYPISLSDALVNLGPWEGIRILGSYLKAKLKPDPVEDTFEQWVSNRFGRRLYEAFFKTYTEKVWGMPCSAISADWAAQRIKGMSLTSTVLNALTGASDAKSLITGFRYPRLGPGMMWETMAQRITQNGAQLALKSKAIALHVDNPRALRVDVATPAGPRSIIAPHVVSSAPLSKLVECLHPAAPQDVRAAAARLRYRDFCTAMLLIEAEHLFPDHWLYIHSPEVRVGRIQNCKNWSAELVPDCGMTSLGMEYFCTVGDDLWSLRDDELIALATREVATLGLAEQAQVVDGTVIRQRRAYPIYDDSYQQATHTIRAYLETIPALQTIGRNGMHRYNNLDHSMLTGLLAARNIIGEQHDLWQVNAERSYLDANTRQD